MTDTNQKLREALRIFAGCATPVDKSIDARGHAWSEAYLDQALLIARQALALPTAAPVGDLPELPELPEPAAWRTPDEWPMCYQYTHEEPDAERIQWAARYGRKHEQVFTADQMRAYARAALSAGDAVDAQRYRWLREQHWVEPEAVFRLGLSGTDDATQYEREIDAAIDAAMRKGQL